MCLPIDKKKHPSLKPIVLDKPMIVYKYGTFSDNDKYFSPYCFSNFVYTQYEPYIVKMKYETMNGYAVIKDGYHAYTAPNQLIYEPFQEAKFLIPAGANVYFDAYKTIVSDRIVYLGPMHVTNYKKSSFKKKVKHLFKKMKKSLVKAK